MPASRSPARSANSTQYQDPPNTNLSVSNAQRGSLLLQCTGVDDMSPPSSVHPKKRRAPNAFILYRSHIIAKKLYPPELKHQSDITRFASQKWWSITESERSVFFEKSKEAKLRLQHESSKTDTERNRSRQGESSPTSDEVASFPTSSMVLSPSSISPTSFDPLALPLRDAYTSLLAPQPIHPVPPHLLNWGREVDIASSDAVVPNEPDSAWFSSYPSSSSQVVYQNDADCLDFLGAEMLYFQQYVVGADFMSALLDNPSLGVYPPA